METIDRTGAFVPGPRVVRAPTGRGALDGLNIGVKDLIDVEGVVTGGGNPDWAAGQEPAKADAPVVAMLRAAGASVDGKTITDELAFSLEGENAHFGTPVNPACPGRLPGGSSSGSAVAVAAGVVDAALGTDTGGSVRVPAAFTGVFGMRPTHDALPLDGVVPFAHSYDTVGFFARDIDTLTRVGDALLPPDTASLPHLLRPVDDVFALTDAAVADHVRAAASRLGLDIGLSLFDGAPDDWRETYRVLQGAEIWRSLGPWIAREKPKFGPSIAMRFADAAAITAEDIAAHAPRRSVYADRVHAALRECVLVLPTAPTIAPPLRSDGAVIGEFYARALAMTSIAGHSGAPQITIPAGLVDGCPVGLSIIGRRGADRALLALAQSLVARMAAA